MASQIRSSVSCFSLLVLALAASARAGSSLSGTYAGSPSCAVAGAAAADASAVAAPSTLVVSELAGGGLAVEIDGVAYRGRFAEDRASGQLTRCGTFDSGYNAGNGSTLELEVEGSQPPEITLQGVFGRVGSCKGTWTRISRVDTQLRPCE